MCVVRRGVMVVAIVGVWVGVTVCVGGRFIRTMSIDCSGLLTHIHTCIQSTQRTCPSNVTGMVRSGKSSRGKLRRTQARMRSARGRTMVSMVAESCFTPSVMSCVWFGFVVGRLVRRWGLRPEWSLPAESPSYMHQSMMSQSVR